MTEHDDQCEAFFVEGPNVMHPCGCEDRQAARTADTGRPGVVEYVPQDRILTAGGRERRILLEQENERLRAENREYFDLIQTLQIQLAEALHNDGSGCAIPGCDHRRSNRGYDMQQIDGDDDSQARWDEAHGIIPTAEQYGGSRPWLPTETVVDGETFEELLNDG